MPAVSQSPPQSRLSGRSLSMFAVVAVALFGLLVTGSVAFAGLPTQGAQPSMPVTSPTPDPCALVGEVVQSPYLFGELEAVSAVSTNDIWAAGIYVVGATSSSLVEHWDGNAWRIIPSPNPSALNNDLHGIFALASNDVWAVGAYYDAAHHNNVLAEHWDGTAWSVVGLDPSVSLGELLGVAGTGADDVWAVGYAGSQALIEHWDGLTWSVIAGAYAGNSTLRAVAALSPSDVWVVGDRSGSQGTLLEHWDGTTWSVVQDADVGTYLTSISAVSTNDIWTVGYYENAGVDYTVIEHWDGLTWSAVNSPDLGSLRNRLTGVTAVSANNVWGVGFVLDGVNKTLVEHWDGIAWSVVQSPNIGASDNSLYAVTRASSDDIWTVGGYFDYPTIQAMVEHFYSPCVTTATPTPTPDACPLVGVVVDTPPVISTSANFQAVTAISPSDVWAVGWYLDGVTQADFTLTEHWDGSTWSVVPSPNGAGSSKLSSVAAVASNDVWAVGYYGNASIVYLLAEHWDGTAWTISPLDPSISSGELWGVSALSSSDVWLVGYSDDSGIWQTLTEHWNGSAWSAVPSPDAGAGNNILLSVSALSAKDIWAVGFHQESNGYQTLAEHWDGTAWSVEPSVDVGTSDNTLLGVSAIAPDDVWAVGVYSVNNVDRTLTEHWDGTAWSAVSSPHPGSEGNFLNAVTAISANDIWAVGSVVEGTVERTLVLHWDGVAWSVVDSPNNGSDGNRLNGVAAVSASDIWMAGSYFAPPNNLVLMEHFTSPCITPTLTPVDTATLTNTPLATSTPDPCVVVGTVVDTPPLATSASIFQSIAAVSADDVWVVGHYRDDAEVADRTLAEHWDGTAWSVIPSPNVDLGDNHLNELAAISTNDVWAVGSYVRAGNYNINPLAMHWDGSMWTVSNVAPPADYGQLLGISAVSTNDVWAVGYSGTQTLVEHWDGTVWSVIPSPSVGTNLNILVAVTAISANDVWAVGQQSSGQTQTLVEHWDGTLWSAVSSPNVVADLNTLASVSAVSADDIWAVGIYLTGAAAQTLVEHWDGTIWSIIPSPNPTGNDGFNDVKAISANDVWVVGSKGYSNGMQNLMLHWDGAAWSVVQSPNVASYNELKSLAVVNSDDLWAAGDDFENSNQSHALVEHFTSSCITPTATPTLTPMGTTSATYTSTPAGTSVSTDTPTTMPTNTAVGTGTQVATSTPTLALSPTASPTECVLTFEDVHPGDWDYPYVQWMFCRGVINGYNTSPPCSAEGVTCFKPQNYTTRGQVAKIVVLAFALPIDTTGGPHFNDVPQGSTFYDYIETAYNNGLINGYSDNSFRPGNNVTRAQVAKIAVLAAINADPVHWTLLDPADNTFDDVVQGSTFYRYVETAAAHGVLAGYPCGIAPAGPCGPQNKPYFLPENNATRAQISKIVYIAATSQLRR